MGLGLSPNEQLLLQRLFSHGRIHAVQSLPKNFSALHARCHATYKILRCLGVVRRCMHSRWYWIQRNRPPNRYSSLGSPNKCSAVEDRVCAKCPRLHRLLEHQHESLAAELRVSAGHAEGQEARVSRNTRDILYECLLAWFLSRILPHVHTRIIYANHCEM